jgi:DNA-binding transcriptional LysR family regulator
MRFAAAAQLRHPWPGVEVRHLAALAAIASEKSFGAAAGELGYVQSAVSQQIAQLERVVGTRLVERCRGHRPAGLTPAGELLARHSRTLLEVLQTARADLDALARAPNGALRAAIGQAIAPWLLPAVLSRLADRLPHVRVELFEPGEDDQLPALVEQGEFDLAFGPAPPDRWAFDVRRLLTDPYVLVVPAACARRHGGRLPPAGELTGYRLYAPPPSRELAPIEAQLEAHGLPVTCATRAPVTPAIQAIVGSGRGIALMPTLSVDPNEPATAIVALDGLALPRAIAVYWRRDRQIVELLERFAAVVMDGIAELEQRAVQEVA